MAFTPIRGISGQSGTGITFNVPTGRSETELKVADQTLRTFAAEQAGAAGIAANSESLGKANAAALAAGITASLSGPQGRADAAALAAAEARAAAIAAGVLATPVPAAPPAPSAPSTAPAAAAAAPQPAQPQKSTTQQLFEKTYAIIVKSPKEMVAHFAGLQDPKDRDSFIYDFAKTLEKNFLTPNSPVAVELLKRIAILLEHMSIQEQFYLMLVLGETANGQKCLAKICVNWVTQILPRLPNDKRVLFMPWFDVFDFVNEFPFVKTEGMKRSHLGFVLSHDKPFQPEDPSRYGKEYHDRIWALRRGAEPCRNTPEFPKDSSSAAFFKRFNNAMKAAPSDRSREEAFAWFFNNLPKLKDNAAEFPHFVRAFYLHATLSEQAKLMHFLIRPTHKGCIQAIMEEWLENILPYLPDEQRYLFLPCGFDDPILVGITLGSFTFEENKTPVGTLLVYRDSVKETFSEPRMAAEDAQRMEVYKRASAQTAEEFNAVQRKIFEETIGKKVEAKRESEPRMAAEDAQRMEVYKRASAQTAEKLNAVQRKIFEETIGKKVEAKREKVRKTNDLLKRLLVDWPVDAGAPRSVDTPGVALAKGLDPVTLKASLDAYPDAMGSIAPLFAIKIFEDYRIAPQVLPECVYVFAEKARDEDLYLVINYLYDLEMDCAQFFITEACTVRKSIIVPYGRRPLFKIPVENAVGKAIKGFTDRARYTWP